MTTPFDLDIDLVKSHYAANLANLLFWLKANTVLVLRWIS